MVIHPYIYQATTGFSQGVVTPNVSLNDDITMSSESDVCLLLGVKASLLIFSIMREFKGHSLSLDYCFTSDGKERTISEFRHHIRFLGELNTHKS